MFRLAILTVAVLGAVAAASSAQKLTPAEEKLVAYVDAHNDDAVALLERVVNINSGTLNLEGVREVGRVFDTELAKLGFETRWEEGDSFNRAGHLMATRNGNGRRILLIGHLDTVFEKDSPFQRYEQVSENEVRGPGIIDMKGGNVIVVQALRALDTVGLLDDMSVSVVFIGDEERMGSPADRARAALIEIAKASDVAIAFENGDNDPGTIVVSRRGSTRWRLRVEGKPAHSSQIFREDIGAGAIYEAARILDAFHTQLSGERFLTFNPGLILGGTSVEFDSVQARGSAFGKNNVIAAHAVVAGDLRTISAEQLESAKARMQAIVAGGRAHTRAEIVFSDRYPPMAPGGGNMKLLAVVDRVSRDLGLGAVTAVDPMRAGAADIAFAAPYVEMAIDGLGLVGDAEHTEDEVADMRTLTIQTKRTAVLLHRLTQ